MDNVLDSKLATAWLIMGLAVVQIIVQARCFLHVSSRSESGWTMVSLLFTLIVVVITLAGSLWVMHHLDENMMPMQRDEWRSLTRGKPVALVVAALGGFSPCWWDSGPGRFIGWHGSVR
jgi:cytochrome o ubiquinol oxidase subunit IV